MSLGRKSSCMRLGTEGGIGIFPAELVTEILSWLPVASLMRFKSVSKWWNRLITSPEFPTLHLEKSLMPSSTTSLLVMIKEGSSSCYSIEIDKLVMLDPTAAKVDHLPSDNVTIVGSCNGFLCLKWFRESPFPEPFRCLYNPTTRALHKLPCLPCHITAIGPISYEMTGFGYDSISQDYKVWSISTSYLDLMLSSGIDINYSVCVYSYKTNSWKKIEILPDNLCHLKSKIGVLCNQSLHYAVTVRAANPDSYITAILGFELNGEKCIQIPVPPYPASCYISSPWLSVLDHCLCTSFRRINPPGNFSIWVMKEYGVEDSWTRLFDMGNEVLGYDNLCSVKPLSYSRSGEEVLVHVNRMQLLWYDLRNARVKCHLPPYSSVEVCVQTLISPKRAKSYW